MIANTNAPFDPGHHLDTARGERLIAHPMLVRAASFGVAAGALALSVVLLVTMKITWRPDAPMTEGVIITGERVETPTAPVIRPTERREPIVDEGIEVLPPEVSSGSSTPQTQTASGHGQAAPVITEPHWLETPNARDFERHYPQRALHRGIGGRVVLDCTVGADGRIACAVASEEPQGQRFGEAALRIAQSFRMSAQTVDGQPTDGGRVRVPITFRAE